MTVLVLSVLVVATALVLMAVFIPIAFLPGITGQLYRQFAVTIAVSVVISGFEPLDVLQAIRMILARAAPIPLSVLTSLVLPGAAVIAASECRRAP